MDRPLRWGIIGTGKIARILAAALSQSDAGEAVAVGSRSAERASRFASLFAVPRRYGDYRGVIEDPEVDVVYVATEHPGHREWAVAAAETGKHVLCEKPLAMTREDADAIVDAARRNGVFLMEAFAYRCHPQTGQVVDLLRAGTIGDVRMIDAVFGYDAGADPGNYVLVHDLGGGSILDVGCYTTSFCHLIARIVGNGSVVEAVQVSGAADVGVTTGVDHSAVAALTFDGGLLARVASSVQVDLESSVRIYGSAGMLALRSPWLPGRDGTRAQIVIERRGAEPDVIDVEVGSDIYRIEADAVARSVRDGDFSPASMPWDESLANMATLDRWRAAVGLSYQGDREGMESPQRPGVGVLRPEDSGLWRR